MEEKEQKTPQLCSITIRFPVDSDEQAIEIKKALNDTLSTIPNARVDFQLMSLPANVFDTGRVNNAIPSGVSGRTT